MPLRRCFLNFLSHGRGPGAISQDYVLKFKKKKNTIKKKEFDRCVLIAWGLRGRILDDLLWKMEFEKSTIAYNTIVCNILSDKNA